jgi:glycogen debranching enzyme
LIDIGIVAMLQRGGRDLLQLCRLFDVRDGVDALQAELERTQRAVDMLWFAERRCFLNYDLLTKRVLDEVTTATVLPLLGGLASEKQAGDMARLVEEWLAGTRVGLSSTHPSSSRYESQRYWRGPVWVHINWLLSLGLQDYGYGELAERLRAASADCIAAAGFCEYFDADTGAGCGGDSFSWTAAIAIHWLSHEGGD